MARITTFLAGLLAGASAQGHPPYSPIATVWPAQHTHMEIQFTPSEDQYSRKMVNFDYINLAMRYDITYLSGPQIPLVTLLNFTSLWLNDTLYMITWETPLDAVPNCIALQMGFGMMRPDWMVDAVQVAIAWTAHKSDSFDNSYHRTVMTQKDAGQEEPFSYYYWFENGTSIDDVNGAPFYMHAPSPSGMVVNEYYNFRETTYAAGDPIFALPSSPNCTVVPGVAATAKEAAHAIRTARPHLAQLPLSELFLADS